MIISLVSQEKNLGILTLTDHLISTLGKDNVVVVGWNYLMKDYQNFIEKINTYKTTKSVIIKYIVPKMAFSNQGFSYPKELENLSDLMLYVPTYREELMRVTPLNIIKGADNPIVDKVKVFYGIKS